MQSLVWLVQGLNTWPMWVVWLLQLLFCYGAVLLMLRLFGATGVFVFMGVMIIAANIQVVKAVFFPFYPQPIPLGTALFAATYLSSDILTEYYGVAVARRGILLGFAAFVMMLLCMIFTMGFVPLTAMESQVAGIPDGEQVQSALLVLFTPAPALLLAGMSSYLISQFMDVALFAWLRRLTGERGLWLRNNFSTLLASLVDNAVFSLLAWRVFAVHPVAWHTLIFGYILGTYLLRVLVSILDTPFIYLAKWMRPPAAKV